MATFRNIILVYVVIGIVMYGGGAIAFGDIGPTKVFVEQDEDGDLSANEETRTLLGQVDGAIESALTTVGGAGLVAVYNLLTGLIGFVLWPITVLRGGGAPWDITLLFGTPPVAAFFGAFIALIRGI